MELERQIDKAERQVVYELFTFLGESLRLSFLAFIWNALGYIVLLGAFIAASPEITTPIIGIMVVLASIVINYLRLRKVSKVVELRIKQFQISDK